MERVLTVAIDVPAGVTAETCTAGCKTAGFAIAGLEGTNLELLFDDSSVNSFLLSKMVKNAVRIFPLHLTLIY